MGAWEQWRGSVTAGRSKDLSNLFSRLLLPRLLSSLSKSDGKMVRPREEAGRDVTVEFEVFGKPLSALGLLAAIRARPPGLPPLPPPVTSRSFVWLLAAPIVDMPDLRGCETAPMLD